MHERVRAIVAEVLEVPLDEIADDAAAGSVAGWDSLRQLELMLAIEREFAVRVPAETMLELHSVEAIERYLATVES